MFEVDLTINEPFTLESGKVLDEVKLRCTIYGKLNADKSNAILVFHALTGSSRVGEWWNGVMCDGCALDTSEYAFVCVNYLGSCYGSTSAKTLKKRDKRREVPIVTARDIVRSNELLFDYLGIKKFRAVIGGSVGGMLALQFAVDLPYMTDEIISIAATPLSAMGLALNHIQRQAVENGDLDLARKIAAVSYKSPRQFGERYGRKPNRNGEDPRHKGGRFDIGGYLDHQGETFLKRFEIESYELITKAMDLFDLTDDDVRKIAAKISLVGISSDWLFPAADVRELRNRLVRLGINAKYYEIESEDGHDAFLSDIGEMSRVLTEILASKTEVPIHFFDSRRASRHVLTNYQKHDQTNCRTKTAILPV